MARTRSSSCRRDDNAHHCGEVPITACLAGRVGRPKQKTRPESIMTKLTQTASCFNACPVSLRSFGTAGRLPQAGFLFFFSLARNKRSQRSGSRGHARADDVGVVTAESRAALPPGRPTTKVLEATERGHAPRNSRSVLARQLSWREGSTRRRAPDEQSAA